LGNFFANADANYLGSVKDGENYHLNNSDIIAVDDPMDMSESMQEAMHRSNMDMRYRI
jgi:BRCA1/BRCA2-containing complex subunit 3